MVKSLKIRTFRPHQVKAFEYAKDKAYIALFMEMRLGKTLVAIRWAKHWGFKNILVIAPLSVLHTWKDELALEGIKDPIMIRGAVNGHFFGGWNLVNYERVRCSPELATMKWDAVILDESTRIKNPKSQVTQVINKGFQTVRGRAILSGLPDPEGPMDFYEQFRFLYSGFMKFWNFWAWRSKYFHQIGYKWICPAWAMSKIKKEVNKLAFCMTRKEAGIGNAKIYERRYVQLTPEQRKLYVQTEKDYAMGQFETKYAPVKAGWLSILTGGFKIDEVRQVPIRKVQGTRNQYKVSTISDAKCQEIKNLLKGELSADKVIIWFRYNHELKYAYRYLREADIRCDYITGEEDPTERHNRLVDFRIGQNRALLVQSKCGQYGWDVSFCSTSIYYSNYYDNEVRSQTEDRTVSVTKTEPSLVIDLITEDTIDEDVLDMVIEKKVNSKVFLTKFNEKLKAKYGR